MRHVVQIAGMLPPGDVTTYDQRVARRVPMFPSGLFYDPVPWMRTLQLAVAFALVAMGVIAGVSSWTGLIRDHEAPV